MVSWAEGVATISMPHSNPSNTQTALVCFSAVVGVFSLVLENQLSHSSSAWITLLLSVMEPWGILIFVRHWDFFGIQRNLFRFIVAWHTTELIPPILLLVCHKCTDDEFATRTALAGWQTWAYMVAMALKLVVSVTSAHILLFTGTLVFSYMSWLVTPLEWREWLVGNLLAPLLKLLLAICVQSQGYVILSIRGMIQDPFDRWEIGLARLQAASTTSAKQYDYEPLTTSRHIRLLILSRKSFFKPPICEIRQYKLDEAPPFEALSYTWGSNPERIPVAITNGMHILVTPTVEEFLYYQRSLFETKYLWIDALCIDQRNALEKSIQIPLMPEIYRTASRVIVWLGAPVNVRETRILQRIILLFGSWLVGTYGASEMEPILAIAVPDEDEACKAVLRLFCHRWFERMWIVQEVAVSTKVHILYRGISMQWKAIAKAVEIVLYDPYLSGRFQHDICEMTDGPSLYYPKFVLTSTMTIELHPWARATHIEYVRQATQSGDDWPLEILLALTFTFDSTEPRDKLFGIMGIARSGSDPIFLCNYDEPVEQLYLNAARYLLKTQFWWWYIVLAGRGYDYRYAAGRTLYRDLLPSWALDFSCTNITGAINPYRWAFANTCTPSEVQFTDEPTIITLPLHIVGTVKGLVPCYNTDAGGFTKPPSQEVSMDSPQFREWFEPNYGPIRRFYLRCMALIKVYAEGFAISPEEVEESLWRFFSGAYLEGLNAKWSANIALESSAARELFEGLIHGPIQIGNIDIDYPNKVVDFPTKVSENFDLAIEITHRFVQAVTGFQFAVTDLGVMALVPPRAEVGDVVMDMRGCVAPITFRPHCQRENSLSVVGLCVIPESTKYAGPDWESFQIV